MKIHTNIKEANFTAKSKASGRVVNFASQQNRDNAIKSGEYEETDDTTQDTAPAKPKVNIFDKPTPSTQATNTTPASQSTDTTSSTQTTQDTDTAEPKAPFKAKDVVKKKADILKSKVEKWSEKEKAFFRDGIQKEDSPERRNWRDAIKDKAKGAIAAIKKGAKHEVEEFKAASKGVQNFFSGKPLSEHEQKALKSVAIKVATTAIFGAAMGGAGHGALAFGKHVAMEFIPHVVGETILKGVGKAALFAGDEDEDVYMERFMQIIADKMASEKITADLMLQMVDSYNAKKGEGVNELHTKTPHERVSAFNDRIKKAEDRIKDTKDPDTKKMLQSKVKLAKLGLQNYKQQQALKNKAEREKKAEKLKTEEIRELTPDQSEMVQGIIDMLLQIKDIDNRMEVAQQQIQNFKDEEIVFNYAWFLSAAGLDNNDEPVRMDVKTQPQHIINKESIMIGKINEDFKHIIHVDTPTQVVSKPIAAQILALAKKGVRSKDIGLEMGFVGNQKLATDAFQKVKNKIYFELGKNNESINEVGKLVYKINKPAVEQFIKKYPKVKEVMKAIISKNGDVLKGYKAFINFKSKNEPYLGGRAEVTSSPTFGDKTFYKYDWNGIGGWADVYEYLYDTQNESVNEEDTKSPEETLASLKQMAMGDLERIEDYAEMISDRMKQGQELSAWMYSQITLAVDQLNAVHDTMDGKDGVKESVNEEEIKWNAVENAIINFLKANTKILDKRVKDRDIDGVKGGLKSIISGLTNAQRSLKLESVNEAMGNDKSMLALVDILSNSMEYYEDESDFLQSVRGGQGWSGIPAFKNSSLIPVFKSIYKKYWTISPQNRTNWVTKDWINWLKPFGLEENVNSETDTTEETTLNEKQFKGLEGIPANKSLEKISKAEKLNIIKAKGNMISFIVPDEYKGKRNFWQVISTGNIKKSSSGNIVMLMGAGPMNSPSFKNIDDLINGVDWASMERTRRFNESVNEVITTPKKSNPSDLAKTVLGWYDFYTEYIDDGGQYRRAQKQNQDTIDWFASHPSDVKDKAYKIMLSQSKDKSKIEGTFGKYLNESTPGEQIQNLNNRLTKLRQDMAKAKSPEAKNVIQAKMKNALQKLSDKKKNLGIKKP